MVVRGQSAWDDARDCAHRALTHQFKSRPHHLQKCDLKVSFPCDLFMYTVKNLPDTKLKRKGVWSMVEPLTKRTGMDLLLDLLECDDIPLKTSRYGTVSLESVNAIGYDFSKKRLRVKGALSLVVAVETAANDETS